MKESETPQAKLERLRLLLGRMDSALLAFSGGVDSSFLLRVARDVLGPRLVALTVRSPTADPREAQSAVSLARELGVEHVCVDSDELAIPGYAENPVDRCYFCKGNLFELCHREASRRGISAILDGVNVDDLGDYRPGLRAADEHRVRHPLVEAGLRKQDIRELSREMGLPTWDKPASPCLSSRFPYGTRITRERIAQVAAAEEHLRSLGFRACRVRYHEAIARIEVPVTDLARLCDEELRTSVVRRLRELGFTYVTLDLQGLRSGSLNEVLFADANVPNPGPRAS
ncbi:MAG: adenine nucleotide alpha hydrolase [Candidatus Binatia bacterium]|nr:MAG: adenine nucleotide alpha hydrolase [Candidatus Binatia bacterium]